MTAPNPSPSDLPEPAAPAQSLAAFVESVAERLSAAGGAPALHVSGARGSGAPLIALALARKLERSIVYVAPDADGAEAAARDLRYLLNDPGVGWPEAGPEQRQVRLLLPSESSPYEQVHPDRRAAMHRLAALTALAQQRRFGFLVTSARALVRRFVPPAPLLAAARELTQGQEIDLEELSAGLVAAGYSRNPVVEDPGCIAVRGGLIDVWPADAEAPVRIELLGDSIAGIRQFDPESQRTGRAVERVWLPPASEILLGRRERERAAAELRALCDAANLPSGKTRRLLEDLIDGHSWFGAEGYLPACYELVTLWEHLPEDALWVFERPSEAVPELRATLDAALLAAESPAEFPRYPLERLFVPEPELLERLGSSPRVFAHASVVGTLQAAQGLSALELAPLDTPELGFQDQSELTRAMTQKGQHGHATLGPLVRALEQWRERALSVVMTARTETQARRMHSLLEDRGIASGLDFGSSAPREPARGPALSIRVGGLTRGLIADSAGYVLLTEEEVFGHRAHRGAPRKQSPRAQLEDLRALSPGDYVVHVEHGIGRYLGLENRDVGTGAPVDLLVVEYRGGDKLFVPVYRMNQIQKLSGGEVGDNRLDRLGGQTFAKTKAKVKRQVREMADELLALYAERAATERAPLPAPDAEYLAFEASFPFEETPDQATAIDAVLSDLEKPAVMDRLVCGDVGFGKTEVALRAAFRHLMAGNQVALLCPTTLLANQHYQTAQRRFADYPIKVEMLSRFRNKKAQTQIVHDLRAGNLDLIVGTHRLLSKDVHFKRLGLLIVDEEQRFGVAAKERIKQLRKDIDVLTLSATPIPRTLQLALGGLQDLSIIATPPLDRRAVRTTTARYDDALVQSVIERELARGGQAFYVYNRIEGLAERAARIQALLPRARVAIGHGQMSETLLERTMLGFVQGEYDVLVTTAIVESGLDIPRANTLIVDRADLFGLAQLYQLRGRVGRSSERAYCYLLVPPPSRLTDEARLRVDALTRYTELGSGLQVAELDLELRGAGNFLGAEQSGAVASVGFELFCQMLQEATQELRGQRVEQDIDPEISIDIEALLPQDYVPEVGVRLSLYKRLAGAADEAHVHELAVEIEDRFGSLPRAAQNLIELMRLKAQLRKLRVLSCEASARAVTLHLREDTPLDVAKITRLALERPELYRVTPLGQVVRRATERERSAGGLALAATLLREIAPAL
ncbi:MAG TPA: transcription-repair coupling factor [Polyangiaceae bacterium]|nr:transcription-repair coupling factor [Polyangiaceae bacterium]